MIGRFWLRFLCGCVAARINHEKAKSENSKIYVFSAPSEYLFHPIHLRLFFSRFGRPTWRRLPQLCFRCFCRWIGSDWNVLAVSVEGTDTDTVIRAWLNPDGAADSGPSDGGDPDCQWDASGTDELDFTSYADSGEFVGLYCFGDDTYVDNF